MTPEQKKLAKDSASVAGVIAAAAAGVMLVTNVVLPPVKQIRLAWDDANPTNTPGLSAEFHISTNLVNWSLFTNVPVHPGSNFISFPRDLPRAFFKIRNRQVLNGVTNYSDWSRK